MQVTQKRNDIFFEATQHTKQFLDVCSAIKILRLRHIQCSLKYGSVDNKTQLQVGGIVIFAVYVSHMGGPNIQPSCESAALAYCNSLVLEDVIRKW